MSIESIIGANAAPYLNRHFRDLADQTKNEGGRFPSVRPLRNLNTFGLFLCLSVVAIFGHKAWINSSSLAWNEWAALSFGIGLGAMAIIKWPPTFIVEDHGLKYSRLFRKRVVEWPNIHQVLDDADGGLIIYVGSEEQIDVPSFICDRKTLKQIIEKKMA
jgi:hypothetical protein